MMNSTTTTLTNEHSVRPWLPLADLAIGQVQTVGFGIADTNLVSNAVKGKAISGPTEGTALLAASESPPALATAAESAQLSAKTAVNVSRQLMGFGARRTGAGSKGYSICLTSKTVLSQRHTHLTTLPHLVGLEAGSVVLELGRHANEFEEILTAIEPCGSTK